MHDRQLTGVLVQVRSNSRRLPGKALRPLRGKPMLEYVLERLERCTQPNLVAVCTTQRPEDDAIASLCEKLELRYFRGAEQDVAQRLLAAAERFGLRALVRVCGDSPLIDPALVDYAITLYEQGDYDVVTNTLKRTYPSGQSVELVETAALRRAVARMRTPEEREHVTSYFYTHPDEFHILNFTGDADLSSLKLSVDDADDLARVETIISQMKRPHWDYGLREIVERFCTMPV